MPNAAIYCRISKTDSKIPKVELQEVDCRALADKLHLTVADDAVFVDDGKSATKKGVVRTDFERLVLAVARGEFDFILAKEQSRFERSPMERERLAMASVSTGTVWHTVYEGEIDPADGDDEFMSIMRSGLNRKESRNISRRVSSAINHRIAAKLPIVTKRPFGFEDDGVTHRAGEAAALVWAVDSILGGGSMGAVLQQFREDGITPVISRKELKAAKDEGREPVAPEWTHGSLLSLLKRERNAGRLVHKGQVVGEAAFTAIIEPDKHDLLASILANPARRISKDRTPRWLMSGIAVCGTCGHVMRPTTVNGRPVYRCGSTGPRGPVRHPMIMCHLMDDLVAAKVAAHYLTASGNPVEKTGSSAATALHIQQQLATVREEKSALAELATTPGFAGIFRKKAAELFARETDLQAQLDSAAVNDSRVLMEVESRRALWSRLDHRVPFAQAAEAKADIAKTFKDLPLTERRAIVRSLIRVTVTTGVGTGRVAVESLSEDEDA